MRKEEKGRKKEKETYVWGASYLPSFFLAGFTFSPFSGLWRISVYIDIQMTYSGKKNNHQPLVTQTDTGLKCHTASQPSLWSASSLNYRHLETSLHRPSQGLWPPFILWKNSFFFSLSDPPLASGRSCSCAVTCLPAPARQMPGSTWGALYSAFALLLCLWSRFLW